VSFEAADLAAGSEGVFTIDAAYVDKQLKDLAQNEDLSRYIL
jgi:ATP-dependent protease HslVU (ClpYQ) ATPase subunit